MKKLLLGIVLGFFIHTGLSSYYSYSWWTADKICEKNKVFEEEIECVYKELGNKELLSYLISYPSYDFQQWDIKH